MTKFTMLFDNGGGVLLLTNSFCHSYERPTWAADDASKLLDGESTKAWDGNQPEYRRERHAEDDLINHNTAQSIYNGESWKERGAAFNAFCLELARLGQKSKNEATAPAK